MRPDDDKTEETPEVEATEAAAEEKPKPKRSRAKKAAEEPAVEAAPAEEPAAEEAPAAEAEEAVEEPAAEAEPAAEDDGPTAAEVEAKASQEAAESQPASKKAPKSRTEKAEPATPAPPAPKRGRKRGSDNGKPAERVLVQAKARYVRTSPRKARLVCDHIRGKDVAEARAILAYTPRGAAKAWIKLLESAVANAEHNHELVGDELRIAAVYADEGPTLKRFRPRAMGRATRIRKRTSHLTIALTPKES